MWLQLVSREEGAYSSFCMTSNRSGYVEVLDQCGVYGSFVWLCPWCIPLIKCASTSIDLRAYKECNEIKIQCTNKAPSSSERSYFESQHTLPYIAISGSNTKNAHNPFPTLSTPLQTHCPNCFSDVCGVTASPASSNTHISPQRLDPQTLTSLGNTELSAAHCPFLCLTQLYTHGDNKIYKLT
jgi:hypothetical protein